MNQQRHVAHASRRRAVRQAAAVRDVRGRQRRRRRAPMIGESASAAAESATVSDKALEIRSRAAQIGGQSK